MLPFFPLGSQMFGTFCFLSEGPGWRVSAPKPRSSRLGLTAGLGGQEQAVKLCKHTKTPLWLISRCAGLAA